ncbi:13844_t:CDS:1 [Entrophospora sp. SA101]|nr:13844_t:CDS:1 [Entrophospora sp. SA101]
MLSYIINYIAKAISYLDDSRNPFEDGDLIEVREIVEYKEVKTPPTIIQNNIPAEVLTQKKTRAKAIVYGKYAKQKGEKVADWRRRIIPKYIEVKQRNLNPESKYYTTDRINNFIKEIKEIESE